jgi:hypothetical protein
MGGRVTATARVLRGTKRKQTNIPSAPTIMSIALKTIDATHDAQPYRLSARELTLRYYFIAAFTGVEKSPWALRAAAWRVTDELKEAGLSPDALVQRIRYIAAIPLSFHYRSGYRSAHARLAAIVDQAIVFCAVRYAPETATEQEVSLS